MKDDARRSSEELTMSADYEQLQKASMAGDRQRRAAADNGNNRHQRRTYSCKYPSRSAAQQSVRRRDSARDDLRTTRTPTTIRRQSQYDDDQQRCYSQNDNSSAPHSRSSSCRRKLRRPRDVREFRETYSDSPSLTDNSGVHYDSTNNVSLEETINSKLQQLKLLQDDDCCVVRCFDTTSRGFVNRGDSFKRRNQPLTEPAAVPSVPHTTTVDVDIHSSRSRTHSINTSTDMSVTVPGLDNSLSLLPTGLQPASYTVLVLGQDGVGRTALLQQFMTSEFMAAETTLGSECEKTVSVLLDGEETLLNFVDLPLSVQQECIQYTEIEAYLVVYSITDRRSFRYACDILRQLRAHGRSDAAVVLVANKSDLVRGRQVSDEEGRAICDAMHSKFIQVSAALNHRVDDLLVGLVHQIRLNPARQTAAVDNYVHQSTHVNNSHVTNGCFTAAKEFFVELLSRKRTAESNCDNLWTL